MLPASPTGCLAAPQRRVLGHPPPEAGLAALTHGPGHRQAADVQRLISLYRLPHRFQDIHCRNRRGGEDPLMSPATFTPTTSSPPAPISEDPGDTAGQAKGCWLLGIPLPEGGPWAVEAAGSAGGTVPCSGRSSVDTGSSVAACGSPLLAMARSATICKRRGPQCLPLPPRLLGCAHTRQGPCIPPWSTSRAGPWRCPWRARCSGRRDT